MSAEGGVFVETSSSPDVSFVIPVKNEADYLDETLSSIAALKTDYEYEVFIVDGGAADDTRKIAADYDVTVIDQNSGGIGAARHQGAMAADGRWFAFIDADTRLRTNYLTAMIEFFEREGLVALSDHRTGTSEVDGGDYQLRFSTAEATDSTWIQLRRSP